ncbi:serine/threonine protein kinase [Trypanosoma brucei brucei TREU927]|uniref:non-specific serine/threonine protein kinase n=1 Tax=Trypanosoma brucei brucei (strain 927/4 GUTat10.1) TaxID=185431 RepID=Q38BA7_TRYB2|nr:serine/threonine protein kinase [Trypanosoma brucei brucei TREU927]EAN77913.1 serine/threonine protein kinase [Trypanosoma brucei brucei TREU927]
MCLLIIEHLFYSPCTVTTVLSLKLFGGGEKTGKMSDVPKSQVGTDAKVAVAKKYTGEYYVKGMVGDKKSFAIEHSRGRQKKHTVNEFCVGDAIGRGAFAEVFQCWRPEEPHIVYAMKKIRKDLIVKRKQSLNVHTERDLLSDAKLRQKRVSCPWITDLVVAFQDQDFLYIVTEYCSGGDLISWLIRYDVFPEETARFYFVELVLALNALHKMGYVHRDVKPDNVLIDREGHVKLADFGLSKRDPDQAESTSVADDSYLTEDVTVDDDVKKRFRDKKERKVMFFSTVGSPAYIAPEVLIGRGYDYSCDWWSAGVILYEMIFGYPPFFNDNNTATAKKIIQFKEHLEFPKDQTTVSKEAIDLISHLIADSKERYGFEEIIRHPFCKGVPLTDSIRNEKAPFSVELNSPRDLQYFEPAPDNADIQKQPMTAVSREDQSVFVGFTSKLCDRNQSTTWSRALGRFHELQNFSDDD